MGLLSLPSTVIAARKRAGKGGRKGSSSPKHGGDGAAGAEEPVAEEPSLPTAEVNSWSVSVRRIYSQARQKLQQDPLNLRLPAVCTSPRSGSASPVSDSPRSRAETPTELPEPSAPKEPSASAFRAIAPPPLGADLPSAPPSLTNALKARGSPKAWASKGSGSAKDLNDGSLPSSPSAVRLQRTLHAVQSSASEGAKVRRAAMCFQEVLKERKERLELEKAEQEREREHQRKVAEWKVCVISDVVHSLDHLRSERRKSEFGEDRAQVKNMLADIDSMLGRLNALKGSLAMEMVQCSNITVDYASNIDEVKRLVHRLGHHKGPPRLSEACSKVVASTEALETAFEPPMTKAKSMPSASGIDPEEDMPLDAHPGRHSLDAKDLLSQVRQELQAPHSAGLGLRARLLRSATRTVTRAVSPAPVTVPLDAPNNSAKQADARLGLKKLGSRSIPPLSRSSTQRSDGGSGGGAFGELLGIAPTAGSDSEPGSPGRPGTRKIWNTAKVATQFALHVRTSIKEEELGATPVPEDPAPAEALLPGVPATVAPELDVSVAPEDGAFSPRGRLKTRRTSTTSLQRLKSQRTLALEEEPSGAGSPPTSASQKLLKGHSQLSLLVDPVDDSLVAGGTFVSSFRSLSPHTSSGSWTRLALASGSSGGLTARSSMVGGEGGSSSEGLGAFRTRQPPSTPRAAPGSPAAGSLAPLTGVLPRTLARPSPRTTIEGILLERKQRGLRRRRVVSPGSEQHWRRYAGDLDLPVGSAD